MMVTNERTYQQHENPSMQVEFSSWLSRSRKRAICESIERNNGNFFELRTRHMSDANDQICIDQSVLTDSLARPAWWSHSQTRSQIGYRLAMGFNNKGCAWWRESIGGYGCITCGFWLSVCTMNEPSSDELFCQYASVIDEADKKQLPYDVIEFLCDGSFFNFDEYPIGFQNRLFEHIAKNKNIKRVLVESRPEYINQSIVECVCKLLRDDQHIEIGIGLETADDFIRNVCIRKGFGIIEFESAVRDISAINRQLSIVAYCLVKPPLLTEKESIEDILLTLKYLNTISDRYNATISAKLEPCFVAKGTMMEALFFNPSCQEDRYTTLCYWSIVEIIFRSYLYNLHSLIRVGTRYDMGIIQKIPAIYNSDGSLSIVDSLVYESVQSFNNHRSVSKLANEIRTILMISSDSFNDWAYSMSCDGMDTIIPTFIEDMVICSEGNRVSQYNAKRRLVYENICRLRLDVEGDAKIIMLASELKYNRYSSLISRISKDIEERVSCTCGRYFLHSRVRIEKHFFEEGAAGRMIIYAKILTHNSNYAGSVINVWFSVSTK